MRKLTTILTITFSILSLFSFSQISNNFINNNQIVCDGGTPFPAHGTFPIGGNGTYNYLWLTSNDSLTWTSAPGTNTEKDYMFVTAFTGQPKFFFTRLVESGGFFDTSNVITITVLLGTPTIDNNFISSDQTLCWGELPDSIGGNTPTGGTGTYYYLWIKSIDPSFENPFFLDYTNNLQYYNFLEPPDTSFYYLRIAAIDSFFNQCPTVSNPLLVDIYSITNNHLEHQIGICDQNDPDTIKGPEPNMLYINSIIYEWQESYDNLNWNPASGINDGKDYIPSNIIDSMFFRRRIIANMNLSCGTLDTISNPVKVKRNPPIINNIVFTYHPIACNAEHRWILQDTLNQLHGGNEIFDYLWEESSDNINWVPAFGDNGYLNYKTPALFNQMHYRRIVFSGGCVDTSNNVHITVEATSGITNNKILINGQESDTICAGETINTFIGTIPGGGTGSYNYLWLISYDKLNWEIAPPDELSIDYNTTINNQSTYYIRNVSSGNCFSESDVLSLNVINALDNEIWDNQNVCTSSQIDTIQGNFPNQTFASAFFFLWQESNDSINWINATGSSSTQQNYYPGNISSTKYFRRIILFPSGSCDTSYISNIIKITINGPIQNNQIFPENFPDYTICSNTGTGVGNLTNPTGGDGTYLYQWQDSTAGSSWQNCIGLATNSWYFTPGLFQDTYYRRIVTSCGYIHTSNVLHIIVDPLPTYNVHIDDSICIDNGAQIVINFQGLSPWQYTFTDGVDTYTSNNIFVTEYIDYLTPTENSTFTITNITDANGCHPIYTGQSFDVIVFNHPFSFAGFDTTFCDKFTTEGLNAILSDSLNNGQWINHPDIQFDDPFNPNTNVHADYFGTYTLEWREFNARCDDLSQVNITFIEPIPQKDYADDDVYLDFEFIYSLNGIVPENYNGHWETIKGDGLFVDDFDPNTVIYNLNVGDNIITWTLSNDYCGDIVDTLLINVNNGIKVPTGFSPNMDGINDEFFVRGLTEKFTAILWVFNRWGVEVYYNEDYKNDWQGTTYNNETLPSDTYFYILEIVNVKKFKGSLEIKR